MKYLGVDPSERHTGLVVLEKGHRPLFHEIYTKSLPTLLAGNHITVELLRFWTDNTEAGEEICFSVEKQLPVGAESSALMFHIYMLVMGTINMIGARNNFHFVSPLPQQLKSYIRKELGLEPNPDSKLVADWRAKYNYQERISTHRVEAWCLARLARDVLEGRWGYKLPSREAPLVPWVTQNGNVATTGRRSG